MRCSVSAPNLTALASSRGPVLATPKSSSRFVLHHAFGLIGGSSSGTEHNLWSDVMREIEIESITNSLGVKASLCSSVDFPSSSLLSMSDEEMDCNVKNLGACLASPPETVEEDAPVPQATHRRERRCKGDVKKESVELD